MNSIRFFIISILLNCNLNATNPYDGLGLSEDIISNVHLMISPRPDIEPFFDKSVDPLYNRGLVHTCVVQLNDFYRGLGGIFFELNSKARETEPHMFEGVSSFNALQNFLKDRIYEAIEKTPFHPYNFNRYPQPFEGPMDPIPGKGMGFLNSLNIPQSMKDILTPLVTEPDPFTMRVINTCEMQFADFQLNFPDDASYLRVYGAILNMSENISHKQQSISSVILY